MMTSQISARDIEIESITLKSQQGLCEYKFSKKEEPHLPTAHF